MDRRAVTPASRIELALVASLLLLAVIAGGVMIGEGSALGWDESVYAIATRNLVDAHPAIDVVRSYRPPGLPVVATVAALAGWADPALRLVSLVMGIGSLLAAWLLARLVFGPRTAILGLAACVAATVVLQELPLFHNDIASAGVLLLIMALLWHQLEVRPEPGAALLLAAPLAAAAFYLRYGVLAALIGIALAAGVIWWRLMWSRKWLVLATVGLTFLLVLPHLVWATSETGLPWGIVVGAADQVNTSSPLESLLTYLSMLPTTMGGPVTAVFVVAGGLFVVVVAVRQLIGQPIAGLGRPVTWLAIPALVAAAGTISVSHAEARYVLFSMILATILGAEALARAFDRLVGAREVSVRGVRPTALGGLVLAAAVLVMVGVIVYRDVRGQPEGGWYRDLGLAVASEADRPCVVATTLAPMLGWYSGCRVMTFAGGSPAELLAAPEASRWLVITSVDAVRARPAVLDGFNALATGAPVAETSGGPRWARAYLLGR